MGDVKALAPRQSETGIARLNPQALIEQAVAGGAGIETLERLVALAKDVRAEQAREAWHDAMAEFQRTCPPIKKTAKADTGKFKYRYAPLDEIMTTILPVMGALGLSVSWRGKLVQNAVSQNCRISHALGHSEESGEVSIPIESGDRGATPPQRVGIATTYAKRYALLSIIGLAPEDDDDAQSAGESRPTVQQPRRASAPSDDSEHPFGAEPISESARAQLDGEAEGWTRLRFVKHALLTGTNKNGAWELHSFHDADGTNYGTFDKKLADFLLTKADGKDVLCVLEKTDKGNWNIMEARLA